MSEKRSPALGVSKHIDLTDKEVLSVIDHGDDSITPAKLRAIDSPADGEAPTFDSATGKFKWESAVYNPFGRRLFHDMMGTTWSTWHSGTASTVANYLNDLRLGTGTTINSRAAIFAQYFINPSKNPEFEFTINPYINKDNAEIAVQVQTMAYPITKNGTGNRMAFHIYQGTLYAVTANPTGRTETNLGAVSDNTVYQLRAKLTAGVKCEFFSNGTLAATHTTNLPTGAIDLVTLAIWNLAAEDCQAKIYQVMGLVDY